MPVETIGYVGLDHHHRAPYLESIERLPVEVTCACEPDESFDVDSIDDIGDVPVYHDAKQLLAEEDVDALWVTLSNRDAPDVIQAAAEAGVHVYTEKPIARTAAELAPVVDAVESSESVVCVSLNWRWHPISRELKRRIESGFFGEMRTFDTRFIASALHNRDADHYLYDREVSRGGIVQWLGVHYIDLLSWLIEEDPIRRVNASLSYGTPGVEVEDGATIQLETESGVVGNHQCGYYLREGRYDTQVNLYGSETQSTWDPMGPTFGFDDETTLELDSQRPEWASTPHRSITYEYTDVPGYGGQWGLEFMEDFLAACDGNGPVPVGLDDAMRLLRILDAVYESADRGEWVTVETPEAQRLQSATD